MAFVEQSYTVSLVDDQCRFSICGFWKREEMGEFLAKLDEACLPLVKARKPIYALGDFTDFVAQDSETGEAIRDHLINAQKFGLKKIAITGASALVKLQYRRLSAGIEVEFFDAKHEAAGWLQA